ncbi:Resolvase, N terminal domain [Peptoclostridium litorale DSM 5388]|uniref:Resolvase/invertase-type recombinase catalytic domain-containing protein n=1 Tax=Peptoclostridium litorale DSM 5388 TaxID=1121324 RepID=A0A069RQ73_PEPLI|nr:recombinase family protein [Peptoclostridium litorale]KDR96327.1 hypothetical protein CLIT_4c01640 [Peptoclostridium litorale DSM 5388]SIO26431.1 Resolvase, N terminal domain [Peptoclostridium litorale DSM 5388]
MSAREINKPQIQELLEFARKDDAIYVHDFSRLARSTKDSLDIVEDLERKGVELVSLKENLDTYTFVDIAVFNVIVHKLQRDLLNLQQFHARISSIFLYTGSLEYIENPTRHKIIFLSNWV